MAGPKYQQIADDLLLQMDQGTLRPGDRLPSEPELSQAYGASRNTVRLAIAALMNRGLVVPKQGLGTFVADEIVPYTVLLSEEQGWQDDGQGDAYISAVRMAGRNPEELRVVVEVQQAAEDVAERLAIAIGESVVRRHAERLIDGRPWSMLSSFYPMDIARGTRLELAGGIGSGGDRTAYAAQRPIRFTRHIYPTDRNRNAYDVGELPPQYGGPPKQPPKTAR